jgi:protein SCO1/2
MTMNKLSTATLAAWLGALAAIHAGDCCSTNSVPSCCAEVEAAPVPEALPEKSLYQSESKWMNDANHPIQLSALAGKPQVVAMFFAHCQFTCPVTVHDMQRIEAALPPATRAQVGFTLVSFDSKRDTPAALAEYRKTRQLVGSNWTLLRGEPEDVQELSALLGVNFKQDARGDFSHSNLITVLNAQGEVVYRLVGLNQDIAETVRKLEELTTKPAASLADASKAKTDHQE